MEHRGAGRQSHARTVPVLHIHDPLFSETNAVFEAPGAAACSSGDLACGATGWAVAVEISEEAAVDARRSFLRRAPEGEQRPSVALPLVSEDPLQCHMSNNSQPSWGGVPSGFRAALFERETEPARNTGPAVGRTTTDTHPNNTHTGTVSLYERCEVEN